MRRLFVTLLLAANLLSWAQAPSGYYNAASGKTGDELKTALHDIIKGHTTVSYNNLWNAFWSTDNKGGGIVWDMYSDVPGGTPPYVFELGQHQCGSYSGEGDCYNREHSWPKSWFGSQTTPECDLHHIFPTDGYVNQKRDNYPFGEVQSASWTSQNGSKRGTCKSSLGYSGTVFEPIDAYKGDFARAIMYMSVRYCGEDSNWGSSGMTNKSEILPWAIAMLMDWNEQDPVSQKEIDRNNAIYADYQHNRNPFVDHPEYARMIWDENGQGGGGNTGAGDYVKVTAAPADWSGEYLIVFEGGPYAFNGALTTLDAINNYIDVAINDETIAATTDTEAARFTIVTMDGGYSIQAASGKYIGNASNSNALTSSDTPLVNTLAYNNGNIDIVGSGGAYLRFNSQSGQNRFRYYKSSSYSSQQPIQLYKKTDALASQTVALFRGWNWWAPMVETTLETLQASLGDTLVQIKSQDGTPTALVLGQMYRIQTNASPSFTLSGVPASNVTITITTGCNWFGYTGTGPLSLADLNITPAVGDKIVSQNDGFALYNGTSWVGTLSTILPGRGYVYVSMDTGNKTLILP